MNSDIKVSTEKKQLLRVEKQTQLLEFLLNTLSGMSRTHIKSLLSHGQIAVNQQPVTAFNFLLQPGQTVSVLKKNSREDKPIKGLKIIHEDKWLIIIEKEAGLLSIATSREKDHTAYSLLSRYVKKENKANKIFIVHRLDRDTSGVMVYAKSEKMQALLQNNWNENIINRSYLAVVEGRIKDEEGVIRSFLKENKAFVVYSTKNAAEGVEAITRFRVIKRSSSFSLLEIELETGRKNQIRAHMNEIGHPVIGDKKYGSTVNPIGRVGLHAKVLSFIHPVTGKQISFESRIPRKFLALFGKNENTPTKANPPCSGITRDGGLN